LTLYLVATPIGNLGDMSARAIEVLKSVDLIASEDTRKTGVLLKHFGVEPRQMPFHDHNEAVAGEKLLRLLEHGKDVAVVTDGGTPGISDPGFTLVRAAIERGLPVTMVPGPTAFVAALVLSGLPVHSFTFRGFPPRKSGPRRRFYEADLDSPHTLIYYESPYRLVESLDDARAVFGDRRAALANDLTKTFAAVWRGALGEIAERAAAEKQLLGEYVLVVAGTDDEAVSARKRRRQQLDEPDAPAQRRPARRGEAGRRSRPPPARPGPGGPSRPRSPDADWRAPGP
jgi:16S rRNA (cytidine1402-2'-O)-methyltransferase